MKCKECNSDMVLKESKFGKFYGCSSYPNCSFTQNVKTTENAVEVEKILAKSEAKSNGFHLTPEQVRSNALTTASLFSRDLVELVLKAKQLEQYILTGN